MNILILTAHFPHFDQPGLIYATPFISKYASEWVKLGHSVTVIHYARVYPKVFHIGSMLAGKIGIKIFEKYVVDRTAYKESEYENAGYKVYRFLYKKYIPHSVTSKFRLTNCLVKTQKIIDYNEKFDLIIGDCLDPVVTIINNLKINFICTIAQVVHAADFLYFKKSIIKEQCRIIDYWLIRSDVQRDPLLKIIKDAKILAMHSGIEEEYINEKPVYRNSIHRLLYVGALYKSKGVSTLLQALALTKDKSFTLKIVGKGPDEAFFKDVTHQLGLDTQVEFIGQVPHKNVFSYMKEADCLILVSHETFGLVYVEAMSQGCIPIGAIGEGIDGIVKDGVNGFLVPLGNSKELGKLFKRVKDLSDFEISNMSRNAYTTATSLTDRKLAKELICLLTAKEDINETEL